MPNNIAHFQVLADDLARCRRFYERVFGWQFRPWGPPDFYMIQTGPEASPGIHGSLSKRHHPLHESGAFGFECTISVEDVDAIARGIVALATDAKARADFRELGKKRALDFSWDKAAEKTLEVYRAALSPARRP